MADDEKLTPADPSDVEAALALALTSGTALGRSQAAETMSKIVAERLVAQLKESGFVVMQAHRRRMGVSKSARELAAHVARGYEVKRPGASGSQAVQDHTAPAKRSS
jgi:hypothetical protein